ncbi:aldo/keto reductase [Mycobacterium sp. 1081908.1]|uniref:aldo/keto reductase n=1 Tax=Mycobacterium sp. 1081908.1 TaxID=1834066 RepID=UPI001E4D9C9F|nr:aldo/keto reductase [Mycobacterium sp. 1081908.1]
MHCEKCTLGQVGPQLAVADSPVDHLTHRRVETDGMLDAARRLGVSLLAYSSRRQGILTGKYHADHGLIKGVHPLRRKVMGLTPAALDRSQPLINAMRVIAAEHNATVGQIVRVLLKGRWFAAEPTAITDTDRKCDLLAEFVRRNGSKAARGLMIGLPGDRQPNRQELLAAASKTTMVRFALAPKS